MGNMSLTLIAFGKIFFKATGGDTQLKSPPAPIGSLKLFKIALTSVTGPPERDRQKGLSNHLPRFASSFQTPSPGSSPHTDTWDKCKGLFHLVSQVSVLLKVSLPLANLEA